MLKEFHVKNFLSFHDEAVFSMEALPSTKISEFPEHVISVGDQRVLKLASFYGPNGGGKSNLLKAIRLVQSVILGKTIPMDTYSARGTFYFSFAPSQAPSFSIFFATLEGEIGYHLEVGFGKDVSENSFRPSALPHIEKEEMTFREKGREEWVEVFARDESGVVSSEVLPSIDLIASRRSLQGNATFLGYAGSSLAGGPEESIYLKAVLSLHREIASIYFFDTVNIAGMTLGNPDDEKEMGLVEALLKGLTTFLGRAGIPVDHIALERVNQFQSELVFYRYLEDGTIGAIPFNMESSGTKKLAAFYLSIHNRKDANIILCDDFDATLHPALISSILKYFGSGENKARQLIINSHDIFNMTNAHFRRDEIWFACRDKRYQTALTSLSDIVNYEGKPVRKDAKYGKQYAEGLYGADPFIEKGVLRFDE